MTTFYVVVDRRLSAFAIGFVPVKQLFYLNLFEEDRKYVYDFSKNFYIIFPIHI